MARKILIEVEVPEGVGEEEVKKLLSPIIEEFLELVEWEKLVGGREVGEREIQELARTINQKAWQRIKEENGWT